MANVLVHLVSADMKTSHGEPATICCSRVLDEPELTTILQLYCLSNAAVILATTFVRLEAMKTVKVAGVGVGVGVGVGEVVTTGEGEGETEVVAVGVGVFFAGLAVGVGVGEFGALGFALSAPVYAR